MLIPRQELTGAERQWASRYEPDDVLRYARGSAEMRHRARLVCPRGRHQPGRESTHRREAERRARDLRSQTAARRERLPGDGAGIRHRGPHSVHRARQAVAGCQPRSRHHRGHLSAMEKSPPASTMAAPSRFQTGTTGTSITATRSPATAPRDSPPTACWSTSIPQSIRTSSTPVSPMFRFPAPASKPASIPIMRPR